MALGSSPQFLSSQLLSELGPSSQISTASQPPREGRLYRPAKSLPYEIREHCVVYLEEELYSSALALLLNLLIAGTDNTVDGHAPPAFVPPPNVLALAATLVVHPSMTNRASSPEKVQSADEALYLLNHINALVGPTNANLSTAFRFASVASHSRSVRRRPSAHVDESAASDEDDGRINLRFANETAVWSKAEDFWQVVGWAFNCSVRHSKRWDRWKVWLDFMLHVLEDDLEEKAVASKTKLEEVKESNSDSEEFLADSLIARYLQTRDEGRTGKRRIMRAVLANGSKRDLGEFGEIWKDETKERKPPKDIHVSKRKKLNVDDGDFGDYMEVDDDDKDSDEMDSLRQPRSSTRQSTRKRGRPAKSETPESEEEDAPLDEDAASDYGGHESIVLRQRFMALLVRTCVVSKDFMYTEDLLDLFTESLRPLPLSIFSQFVLPTTPYLEPHSQASLIQTLFRPLISSEAPTYKAQSMTQDEFETHFLPFPANYTHYVENARVSLLVEGLLRLLLKYNQLRITESLTAKLEEGIKAREGKARLGAKKKVGGREAEELFAVGVLGMSAARMRMLVQTAKGTE